MLHCHKKILVQKIAAATKVPISGRNNQPRRSPTLLFSSSHFSALNNSNSSRRQSQYVFPALTHSGHFSATGFPGRATFWHPETWLIFSQTSSQVFSVKLHEFKAHKSPHSRARNCESARQVPLEGGLSIHSSPCNCHSIWSSLHNAPAAVTVVVKSNANVIANEIGRTRRGIIISVFVASEETCSTSGVEFFFAVA